MAGSEAEERIRAKAVAALREVRPDARIIHELVLTQGGERIDLAAVWPTGMILAEIKSERDTLSRLPRQLKSAFAMGCEVWLCLADKWRGEYEALSAMQDMDEPIDVIKKGKKIGTTWKRNPAYIPNLTRAVTLWETEAGFDGLNWRRPIFPEANGAAMLDMLWAEELREIAGTHRTDNRTKCINAAREGMTGIDMRKAACAALLRREFPRADAPIGETRKSSAGLFRVSA